MLNIFGRPGGVFRKPFCFGELRTMALEERCDRVVQIWGERDGQWM